MKNVPICNIFHRFESNLWSSACLLPYYFLTTLSYNSSNTIYWSVICYWCMYSCRRASCMNHTIISNINSNMSDSIDRIIADQISRLFIRPWNCCSIASLENGTVWKIVSKMLKNLHWTQSSQHLLTSFQIIAILTYTHKK